MYAKHRSEAWRRLCERSQGEAKPERDSQDNTTTSIHIALVQLSTTILDSVNSATDFVHYGHYLADQDKSDGHTKHRSIETLQLALEMSSRPQRRRYTRKTFLRNMLHLVGLAALLQPLLSQSAMYNTPCACIASPLTNGPQTLGQADLFPLFMFDHSTLWHHLLYSLRASFSTSSHTWLATCRTRR